LLSSVVKIDRNSFSIEVADATALLDTEELELDELPLVEGELTVVMKAPSLFSLAIQRARKPFDRFNDSGVGNGAKFFRVFENF
jgi:hypothetical protein